MSDGVLRFGLTLGLLALFLGLESIAPARASVLSAQRIGRNGGLAIISLVAAKLALAGGLASVAVVAQAHGFGLLNQVALPDWMAFALALLGLDFAVWAQHLILHRVPFLWRLHRVHHGDIAMDISTALRFHPFEIVASLAFKAAIVALLGAPAGAAFVFEIILGAGALFSHANIAIPHWLERPLRWIIITPALHLIHHSPNPIETNSNFGFSTSLWDRLFGTYRSTRLAGEERIGLEDWRAPRDQTLPALLANPFQAPPTR
jgi:sterol desaturase/sphingolipid hydroxylase (fatty acid hydroxylase superfamily)